MVHNVPGGKCIKSDSTEFLRPPGSALIFTRHSSRVELSLLTANHRMGVDIETLKPGDGANFPKPGQKVHCHYVLTLTNGTKVDSSRDRGQPFSFSLGRGEVRYRPGGDTGLMIYY